MDDINRMELEISMNNFHALMEAVLPLKLEVSGESFDILGEIVNTAKKLTFEYQEIKSEGQGQLDPEKWDSYEQELHGYINKLLELKELDVGQVFRVKLKLDSVLNCTAPIRESGFGGK